MSGDVYGTDSGPEHECNPGATVWAYHVGAPDPGITRIAVYNVLAVCQGCHGRQRFDAVCPVGQQITAAWLRAAHRMYLEMTS